MGNRVAVTSGIAVVCAASLAAFLFIIPSSAAAGRDDRGHSSFAFSIIDMVNQRLCERQMALGNRLRIPLVHPSKCHTEPEPDPDPVPSVTLSADPQTIEEGESTTLSWSSDDADECFASEGWSGTKDTSGSQSVSPSETTIYHLDCEGPGGVGGDDVVVTVIPDDDPEPDETTVEITADPMNITEGGSSTLTWNSDNADSCTASGGWSGDKAVDGSQSVSPEETTTYTIECEGEGGTDTDSVTINVSDDEPEMGTLIVRKLVIRDDGNDAATTTFSFEVNDDDAISFESDGENSISVEAGTYTVVETDPDGFDVSYNNCTDIEISEGETETCTITNDDEEETPEPTVDITASRTTVFEGSDGDATTTLSWDSTNASECVASNGWSGDKAADGSETVTPTATTTYAITCTGEGGTAEDSVTVNFVEEEPMQGTLLISEVLYDPSAEQGVEAGNEWVEIFNGTSGTLNLSGYFLRDNSASEMFIFPQGTSLESGASLLVTGTSTTADLWTTPGNASWLVFSGFSSQLSNTGDFVELFNTASSSVDAVCWGEEDDAFDCDALLVNEQGESIGRIDRSVDTGTAADWQIQEPNPGN